MTIHLAPFRGIKTWRWRWKLRRAGLAAPTWIVRPADAERTR